MVALFELLQGGDHRFHAKKGLPHTRNTNMGYAVLKPVSIHEIRGFLEAQPALRRFSDDVTLWAPQLDELVVSPATLSALSSVRLFGTYAP